MLKYIGASTTADLITINAPNAVAPSNLSIGDFLVTSMTVMTGGHAMTINGLAAGKIDNLTLDGSRSGNGNLCGGLWVNGAASIDVTDPNFMSWQNCGDGITVNSNLGGTAELRIKGGNIGGNPFGAVGVTYALGFSNGIHMAGGMGGVRCDGTNIHNNFHGLLIDNSLVAVANREFDLGSTCAFDGSEGDNVVVNDALGAGSIHIAGWIGSSRSGSGMNIVSWPHGDIEFMGQKIYNNCLDGVYIGDTTARVLINSATSIDGNGLLAALNCPAAQAAHPTQGWGVNASAPTGNLFSFAQPTNNLKGSYSPNASAWSANIAGSLNFLNPLSVYGSSITLRPATGPATVTLNAVRLGNWFPLPSARPAQRNGSFARRAATICR